jgi:hypothetical protein
LTIAISSTFFRGRLPEMDFLMGPKIALALRFTSSAVFGLDDTTATQAPRGNEIFFNATAGSPKTGNIAKRLVAVFGLGFAVRGVSAEHFFSAIATSVSEI